MYQIMFREFPDVMDLKEVCKILGVSTKTGYKLIASGQLHALKVGRSYRVPKVYLFTYLCKDDQSQLEEEPNQGGKKRK
ncbi:MAG: helix-turn-helix domain-containing protein [Oscillospiraceae bacterium]|nr:helix-turn-helix domain-containing protein [Oscillospiraceae bacterium]